MLGLPQVHLAQVELEQGQELELHQEVKPEQLVPPVLPAQLVQPELLEQLALPLEVLALPEEPAAAQLEER